MAYVYIDQGIGNDRTFKAYLVAAFAKAAEYGGTYTEVTSQTGEKIEVALKEEEFARIIQQAEKDGKIPNLTCENWPNVYAALEGKCDYAAVYSKPRIIKY